jgi:XTP/dITP diphosphohydrolase
MKICLATGNPHKVEEIRSKLQAVTWVSLTDLGCTAELPETSDTLHGNSLQKAACVFQAYGIPCLADDSGLEVEALGGAPGVHSAYYAGPQRSAADNVQKLLRELQPHANRKARFRTVLTLVTPDGTHVFEGVLPGVITDRPRGANGFGYDPVFQPEGLNFTLAELSPEAKNQISHRAHAMQKLADFLTLAGV